MYAIVGLQSPRRTLRDRVESLPTWPLAGVDCLGWSYGIPAPWISPSIPWCHARECTPSGRQSHGTAVTLEGNPRRKFLAHHKWLRADSGFEALHICKDCRLTIDVVCEPIAHCLQAVTASRQRNPSRSGIASATMASVEDMDSSTP